MDSIYVVMPAYNEEDNIRDTVEQWYPVLAGKDEKSRLVIDDSGSTDKTHAILSGLQKEYSKLVVLEGANRLHGPKVIALYDYAIKNGIDYVFQTDSDGQTDPNEFEAFWQMRKEYDGVFGNRTVRGDGADRAFIEKVVCFLLRMYFGVKIPDANAPFRIMRCDIIKKYLYNMPDEYNLPNIMLTTYYAYYGEKMTFKEISFKPRKAGTNSVNIPRIIKIGWSALGDFYSFKKTMKGKQSEYFYHYKRQDGNEIR